MRLFRHIIFTAFLGVALTVNAQQSEVVKKYIDTYKDVAIAEMKRTGVPAAITLAQGIHESGAGMSKLVLASNNHFGIKCKSNWTGESVRHDDDARGECFRKYPQATDSYRDHSDFLKNGQRYASLFNLAPTDYTGWANGLKQAGYATNPKYPQVLIKLIEDYGLQEYTYLGLANASAETETGKVEQPAPAKSNNAVPVSTPVAVKNYPAGQFLINDTKVVFVKKGTSYLAIAKQYDVDLSKLFEFNEISRTESTESDQLVYLQRKRKTGADEYYEVQPGETLHDIAQQQGIRTEALRELNWLNEGEMPAPGEKLSLKKKSSGMPKLALKNNYTLVPGQKTKPIN
ncbi:MAG: glucosaminidase domain-containing protein [Chitinophagaceae bacterium]|nr:glucosaminidase domain-containing protein [Chitinophagaceae bacterium]